MADTIRVGVALDDLVSGPAKKASKGIDGIGTSLDGLSAKFRAVDRQAARLKLPQDLTQAGKGTSGFGKFVQGIGKAFGPGAAQSTLKMAGAIGRADDVLISMGSSLGGVVAAGASGFATLATAALGVATAVAAIGVGAVYVAGKLSFGFAKAALEAGSFRENSLMSFEALLKNKRAADGVFKSAVKLAAITPFNTTDVVTSYRALLSAGFKTNELEKTFTAIGDLASVKGDQALLGRLATILGQIRGKGRLQGDELLQLGEAGLSTGDVLDQLGKKLGKSRDDVRKLQEAGKISSQIAIDAILATIESRFGGGMAKLSKTLTGIISTLVSRPTELFFAAFDKPGGLSKFADKVKLVASFLAESLDPMTARGKRVVGIIDQIGSGFTALFGDFSKRDMGRQFDSIVAFVSRLLPVLGAGLQGFGAGFMQSFGPTLEALTGLKFNPSDPQAFAASIGEVGRQAGEVFGIIAMGLVSLGGLWVKTAAVAVTIGSAFYSALSPFLTGLQLAESIINRLGAEIGLRLGDMGLGSSKPGLTPSGLGAASFAAPGGFGYAGSGASIPSLAAETKGQKRGEGGPSSHAFTLNISGAGLTPDELIARARAEFRGMLAEMNQ
jgi:tape measure domain-containing protein